MKNFFLIVILIIAVICIGSVLRPFWTKYWLGEDMKAAAVYGTKHSIKDTMALLLNKMEEANRDLNEEDFSIEKDKNNTVTITLTYTDEIKFFGYILKEFEFVLEETADEVDELF